MKSVKSIIYFLLLVIFYVDISLQESILEEGNECVEKCADDCLEVIRCINGEAVQINCKAQTGKLHYCNENTLECDESQAYCSPVPGDISCGSSLEGKYYPDLIDCQKYLFCENGKAVSYDCPRGTRFNSILSVCSIRTSCYNFTSQELCQKHENKLIPHPHDKSLYVYCGLENGPELFACKGAYFEFNPEKIACEFTCKFSGRFLNELDDTRRTYFECIPYYGGRYLKRKVRCPINDVFVDDVFHDGFGRCQKV